MRDFAQTAQGHAGGSGCAGAHRGSVRGRQQNIEGEVRARQRGGYFDTAHLWPVSLRCAGENAGTALGHADEVAASCCRERRADGARETNGGGDPGRSAGTERADDGEHRGCDSKSVIHNDRGAAANGSWWIFSTAPLCALSNFATGHLHDCLELFFVQTKGRGWLGPVFQAAASAEAPTENCDWEWGCQDGDEAQTLPATSNSSRE